jgi:hypothetical protein
MKRYFYFGLQTCCNAKKQGKNHKKVKIVKFTLFYRFSGKSCLFSSLIAYANAFSEVIVDCMAKIVFTKLLAM